jgi:hypothetical protein
MLDGELCTTHARVVLTVEIAECHRLVARLREQRREAERSAQRVDVTAS